MTDATSGLGPLTLPVLAVLPLAAVAVIEGPIVFQPAEGSEVERTYTWTESMEPESVELYQNGEEAVDAPRPEATLERTRTLEVVDRFERSAPNQPLAFVRRYDDTTRETEGTLVLVAMGSESELPLESSGTSELEGVGVRFEWNADEEVWDKSFAEEFEGDEDLLEPLEMTNEFIALLPEPDKDVDVDDEWDVDPSRIGEIMVPGGHTPLLIESGLGAMEGVLDPLQLPGFFDTLDGEADGDITVKVKSVEDDLRTMVVTVDVKVTSDHAEAISELLAGALPDGVSGEIPSAEYVSTLEGKGELVWDVSLGRMKSFDFEGDAKMEISVQVDVDADGQAMEFELVEERAGKVALSVE